MQSTDRMARSPPVLNHHRTSLGLGPYVLGTLKRNEVNFDTFLAIRRAQKHPFLNSRMFSEKLQALLLPLVSPIPLSEARSTSFHLRKRTKKKNQNGGENEL